MLRTASLFVVALLFSIRIVSAQELIVNGGFETGNFTGWTNTGAANDNAAPHSGLRNARFGNATLSQSFVTIPGLRYIFSYFIGHTGTNFANGMLVNLTDGTPQVVQTLANQGNLAYNQVVFSYIATTTAATIRFSSTFLSILPGQNGRYVLDDVSFVAVVPELNPTAATLPLFCAMLMLGLGLERRQR